MVGVSEAVDCWLEFLDDVVDCLVMLEVFFDYEAEELCFTFLFQDFVGDAELDWLWVSWVEDGVVGFVCVGDEIVVVEVVDEVGQF